MRESEAQFSSDPWTPRPVDLFASGDCRRGVVDRPFHGLELDAEAFREALSSRPLLADSRLFLVE